MVGSAAVGNLPLTPAIGGFADPVALAAGAWRSTTTRLTGTVASAASGGPGSSQSDGVESDEQYWHAVARGL